MVLEVFRLGKDLPKEYKYTLIDIDRCVGIDDAVVSYQYPP